MSAVAIRKDRQLCFLCEITFKNQRKPHLALYQGRLGSGVLLISLSRPRPYHIRQRAPEQFHSSPLASFAFQLLLTKQQSLHLLIMSRNLPRLFFQRFASSTRPALRSQLPSATLRSTTRRCASGGPRPNPSQSPMKVWPFVAITLLGSGCYVLMARSRDGTCTSNSINSAG